MDLRADDSARAVDIAKHWLGRLEQSSVAGDVVAFSNLFAPEGWLKDMLCLSWDFRSLSGKQKIASYVSEKPSGTTRLARAGLHDVEVELSSTLGPPSFESMPLASDGQGVRATFRFVLSSPLAKGRGYAYLVEDASEWKAFILMLSLRDLIGHEEPCERPLGIFPDHATWEEVQARRAVATEADPTVLIVGGGLTGLSCAVRLTRLGVRALVVEKDGRIGDVWRKRYRSLRLHSPAHSCEVMSEYPWPRLYPKYISKEKVANQLEYFAMGEDLVIWTSSTLLPTPQYDEAVQRWTATVDRAGTKTVLRPKHIIVATGYGEPSVPRLRGADAFKGVMYHASEHRGAAPFRDKKVVVVGAGNTAFDICLDFFVKEASSVTLLQRSPTCVMSVQTSDELFHSVSYPEKYAIDDADFNAQHMPLPFLFKLQAAVGVPVQKAKDKALLDGLARAGFQLTWTVDGDSEELGIPGFVMKRLGSGALLDTGCGQLIVDGKVKVQHGEIDTLEGDAVVLTDGTRIPADVLVLATGHRPAIETITSLFGASITDKIGTRVWDLDAEGEHANAYRPTSQRGLWVAMGMFGHPRYLSKYLALQILAEELGVKEER
ncbi:uncharacterized protein C8Q71DRAFT_855041 [Rhodofomes roseus]|uniref:Cation diffusion facilitator CzcD-associated flavoprotein CzcO n=1 Tax=Rhodofomes roseus TaxID=34475 RepID=A0ABQ8KPE8_9APHY|nr:uncharacterized protein C8Q71DRAFT_855041 [Rhodofomes roseus]KAH9839722.1 hypothetical protein C8Q71DRAFT_855041 [Rhodofomes roseus]